MTSDAPDALPAHLCRPGPVPDVTLADFLAARLDEEERAARAAKPGPWRWDTSEGAFEGEPGPPGAPAWGNTGPDLVTDAPIEDKQVICATGYDASSVIVARADAEHIARHDPVRVLASVAAKRRLLDEYEQCRAAADRELAGEMRGIGFVQAAELHRLDGLERAVQLLAAADAGHPDYRAEDWAP